jgi:peptide/nickel transport system substrate-binding protein
VTTRRDLLKSFLGVGATMLLAACGGGGTPPTSPGAPPAATGPGTPTPATAGALRPGGTLRIGLNSDNTTMDPHLSTAAVDRQVYQSIYNTLVTLKPDLSIDPGLAERWEVSPDGKAYTFFLRKGVVFHDGEPFDATAAKYNIERMLNHPRSLRKGELADVASAEVVDEHTLKLSLKQPSSPLLSLLTDRAGMMVSPKAAEAAGDDFARQPVGTGPFSFVEWVKDDHVAVKKFPRYWGKDANGEALPYLDEVTYKPVPDVNVRLTSLKTGALDIIDQIPPKDIAAMKTSQDPVLSEVPALAFEYFDLQHSRPPFDSKENRLALMWALDREPIIRSVYFGSGTPAHSPIPPSSWAYQKEFQPFRRDLARVQELAPGGFEFTALVTNTPIQKQVSEVYKQQLAEAGITMNIELLEFGTLIDRINSKAHQAVILQWSGRPDPDGNIFNYFSSKGAQNRADYKNPRMDELLDQARAVSDQQERARLYHEAEKLGAEDGRMFYLRFPMEQKAMSVKVQGFTHIADGMIRTAAMWLKQ